MKEIILEIMKIALEKNKRTKNCIFIDFSGHVNKLSIQVYKNGWKEMADADYQKDIFMDIYDNALERLKEILNYLKELED